MGDTVWSAMVGAFENARGELADRLLAAMEAAENEGGDLRGKQAASLTVVPGEASGVPQLDRSIDLRVDDHTEPVGEIRRLLSYSRAHERANHATEKAMANELPSALAELDTCCAAHPNEPEFLFRRGLVLLMLGQTNQAQEALQRAHAIHPGWSELLLRFADAGIYSGPARNAKTTRPQPPFRGSKWREQSGLNMSCLLSPLILLQAYTRQAAKKLL